MLKRKVGIYWRVSWGIIDPVVMMAIFLYFILTMERLQHEEIDYPDIALGKIHFVFVKYNNPSPFANFIFACFDYSRQLKCGRDHWI